MRKRYPRCTPGTSCDWWATPDQVDVTLWFDPETGELGSANYDPPIAVWKVIREGDAISILARNAKDNIVLIASGTWQGRGIGQRSEIGETVTDSQWGSPRDRDRQGRRRRRASRRAASRSASAPDRGCTSSKGTDRADGHVAWEGRWSLGVVGVRCRRHRVDRLLRFVESAAAVRPGGQGHHGRARLPRRRPAGLFDLRRRDAAARTVTRGSSASTSAPRSSARRRRVARRPRRSGTAPATWSVRPRST